MKEAMSYLVFGALVMGGVPLRDLPEIADVEAVHKRKKRNHRNLLSWFKSNVSVTIPPQHTFAG